LNAEELRIHGPVWPVFSEDPYSRYSFFVNHGTGITFMSLRTWSDKLESELRNSDEAGSEFRMSLLMEGAGTLRERIVDAVAGKPSKMDCRSDHLDGSIVFEDLDLGYFLLAAAPDRPFGATLDLPGLSTELFKKHHEADFKSTALVKPREPYHPSSTFFTMSSLPSLYAMLASRGHKRFLEEEIRLSSMTLSVMVKAHQILSTETQQLGIAAAELFRRCEILQSEFREQINCVREVADRIDTVTGEDGSGSKDAHPTGQDARIRQRIEAAYNRQENLMQRYDVLLKRATSARGRKLSDKEKAWISEIRQLQSSVFDDKTSEEYESCQKTQLWRRYAEVSATIEPQSLPVILRLSNLQKLALTYPHPGKTSSSRLSRSSSRACQR
jgi:nucleoporin NUP82